jgi:hypothetical protein
MPARIAPANAKSARSDDANDDGVRRLPITVLQQTVTDLRGPIPEYRRCAAAFMARREDFDQFWCALVGLDGDAVRERITEQFRHREEAA